MAFFFDWAAAACTKLLKFRILDLLSKEDEYQVRSSKSWPWRLTSRRV